MLFVIYTLHTKHVLPKFYTCYIIMYFNSKVIKQMTEILEHRYALVLRFKNKCIICILFNKMQELPLHIFTH